MTERVERALEVFADAATTPSSRAPGTDTAPSDDGRDAAEAALYRYAQEEWGWGSHEYHSVIGAVDVMLDAIDFPRVRAEERAATLREVLEFLKRRKCVPERTLQVIAREALEAE